MGWFRGCLAGIWVGGHCWWNLNLGVALRTEPLRHTAGRKSLCHWLFESGPSLVWQCGWMVLLCGARITGNCLHQKTFPLQAACLHSLCKQLCFPFFHVDGIRRTGSWCGSILPVQTVFAAPAANPCLLWGSPGGRAHGGLALATRVQVLTKTGLVLRFQWCLKQVLSFLLKAR